MRTIPLTQGKVAIVDDADYNWLSQWKWRAKRRRNIFYAARSACVAEDNKGTEWMHRVILGLRADDKRQCDHRDGNGLNNQRSNLRRCTATQNHQSSRKRMVATSRYKGIYWHRHVRKWHARIGLNKKQMHLGYYDSEIDAARCYDTEAIKNFGDFALTNEMLGLLQEE